MSEQVLERIADSLERIATSMEAQNKLIDYTFNKPTERRPFWLTIDNLTPIEYWNGDNALERLATVAENASTEMRQAIQSLCNNISSMGEDVAGSIDLLQHEQCKRAKQ